MGSPQVIMNGARAQLMINGRIVGIFTSCSWGVAYDVQPAFILGRYSPAELTYTAQEPIRITATGFRVVDNGAHVAAGVPKLQELLNHEDFAIALFDRQTNKKIMTVVGVRPEGYDTDAAARTISAFTARFVGLRAEDESGSQGESSGASDLLSGT